MWNLEGVFEGLEIEKKFLRNFYFYLSNNTENAARGKFAGDFACGMQMYQYIRRIDCYFSENI